MAWTLVALALGAYALGLAWFLRRCPALPPARDAPAAHEAVSVLIPARDEAGAIGHTLRDVLAQGAAVGEVWVVDDGSEDATAARVRAVAAQDARVRLLPAPPLPPGWTGKAHALHVAARAARGDWLLFLDADTRLRHGAVAAALSAARAQRAAFLSVWPRQNVASFWERRVQPLPIGLAAAGNALQRLHGPPFPEAVSAWGAFVLLRADGYRRVGGHAAVRGRVLEDTELCRAFRRAGLHAVAFRAPRFVGVRMYAGLRDLWRGWRKNLFASLGASLPATLAVAAYALLLAWGPSLGLAVALWADGPWARWAGLLGLQFAVVSPLAARVVATRAWLGVSPLGAAVFVALLAASAWSLLAGPGVTWKGRRYASDDEA